MKKSRTVMRGTLTPDPLNLFFDPGHQWSPTLPSYYIRLTLAVTGRSEQRKPPVRCTALLARDAKHPQDLVPLATERHTHRAIIDLCSPVL